MAQTESFNSKLVRLKVYYWSCLSTYPNVFQFQTGAIKSPRMAEVEVEARLFQFQTGAIKSGRRAFQARVTGMFQFQTGAIKRDCDLIPATRLQCFNSKLVRLKVTPTRKC